MKARFEWLLEVVVTARCEVIASPNPKPSVYARKPKDGDIIRNLQG